MFRLADGGLELIEIAPGVDLQRDVLGQMGFVPQMPPPRTDGPGLFVPTAVGIADARTPLDSDHMPTPDGWRLYDRRIRGNPHPRLHPVGTGPSATQVLGDFGADVIKVERIDVGEIGRAATVPRRRLQPALVGD